MVKSSGLVHNMDWRVNIWHPILTYSGEMQLLMMPKYMKFHSQSLQKFELNHFGSTLR
jgi:hypothetical protein